MSIRRIESSYATFMEDEKMSAAEMSVLVALAYVANEKRDEDCFPSDSHLKRMTHLGVRTIRLARNNLRSRKIIDWVSGGMSRQGGNVSNRYRFLFPHCKMLSRYERYQQLGEPPTAPVAVPTASDAVPYGMGCRTLRQQLPTNTEGTRNRTSESNTENKGVAPLSDYEFKFEPGIVDKSEKESEELKKRENLSLVDEAMRVCGVKDVENKRWFSSAMLTKDPDACYEVIMTFASEVRQGEHPNAKKLAAILMKRLKALP